MLAEYRKRTNYALGVGFALLIIGRLVLANSPAGPYVYYTGLIIYLNGCCWYAKSKGYPFVLGLVGLLPFIGLVILFVLKDKHR